LTAGGVPVYLFKSGSEQVLKIEFVFNAGHLHIGHQALAGACNALMREGTGKRNAREISEALDEFGSYYENETTRDRASVCLYTLSKHLKNTLPVLLEVLMEPAFPENEVQLYIDNKSQKLRVNLKKVDFIARNEFPSLLFGADHPYGSPQTEHALKEIDRDKLLAIHRDAYLKGVRYIMISGNWNTEQEDWLMNVLPNLKLQSPLSGESHQSPPILAPQKKRIPVDDAIQSALRLGRTIVGRTHPDYAGVQVLNTIFGGYFGSRLMSNIREDKGFTYGIGSGLSPLLKSSMWSISTEVGKEVTDAALHEIYAEMRRLQEEPVGEEEMDLVKNYMAGVFLRSMDGPFSLAERFSSLLDFGLPENWYHGYLNEVKNISSERIMELAKTYLNPSDFSELVVGG
jgi:predicted Zn-dependent peptidase